MRSGKISRKILGVDYAGSLVTDCYAGYDRHATKIKQKCLEHLKRTAKDWLKVTPDKATASRQFFADVIAWTKRGCRWHRRWKGEDGPEKEREAAWLREEQARLEGVVLDSTKAQTLQGRTLAEFRFRPTKSGPRKRKRCQAIALQSRAFTRAVLAAR